MDIRENIEDLEEVIRACVGGLLKNVWTVMPCQVTQDTQDGHVATAQPMIQRAVTDPTTGQLTYEDHPQHVDAPIHHMGGGGVSVTHMNKANDEGTLLYASRPIDSWFQSSGSQQPIDDRMHSLADSMFLSGVRSTPRMLQQVSNSSSQTRSDDKKNVIDHHPTNGTTIQAVDPSTAAASQSFDPFTQATTFYNHIVHPTNGLAGNATSNGVTHAITNTHTAGPTMSAQNGAHTVNANPTSGVAVASTVAHTIQAPNASLDAQGNLSNQGNHSVAQSVTAGQSVSSPQGSFASGSIGGIGFASGLGGGLLGSITNMLNGLFGGSGGGLTSAAMATGAASTNVGALGGDLSGSLPNPSVHSLGNANPATLNFSALPIYVGDTQAKNNGLVAGQLYLNQTISPNNTVVCVVT